jgi:A/G-specific adenine glycosylase
VISWVLLACPLWHNIHPAHTKAGATIDEVNGLWKGLGYYSRASRLLAGAQKAVNEFGGQLPDNAKDMEAKIPGIGRYSAGAICSIAYGEQVPVVCMSYLR